MLQTEPSFAIYAGEGGENDDLGKKGAGDGGSFSFAERSVGLKDEFEEIDDEESLVQPPSPKMYLATGFGMEGFDEEYCKMMVAEDPCNPLFLIKYSQILQSRGNLIEAEDYYLRATIEDPNNGDILMRYAKLVWELHRDKDRASSYFERAARAAPVDCNILAAYASFLWDIDQVQNDDDGHRDGPLAQETSEAGDCQVSPSPHLVAGVGANVAVHGRADD